MVTLKLETISPFHFLLITNGKFQEGDEGTNGCLGELI